MNIQTNNFEETQKAGLVFASRLRGGDAVLLYGNLGAGKTTFMQGLAKGLGIERRIISPTFIIVRRYVIPAKAGIQEKEWIPDQVGDDPSSFETIKHLYHIDLYRTESEDDLLGLGIPEILEEKDSVVAIEWPEKLYSFLPKNRWEITFDTIDENKRKIVFKKFPI